ncbi:MAG: hypothetical protein KDB04_03765 [Acidimicrobiales bacterium]|nr:hypothetical protein [Acidimicrobiales bacterium]
MSDPHDPNARPNPGGPPPGPGPDPTWTAQPGPGPQWTGQPGTGQPYGGPTSGPASDPAWGATAGPPPEEGSGIGGLLAIVLVMLLIGGAIGFFAGQALLDDDDADAVASSDTTAVETTAAPVVDPTVWAHPNGTFQAAMPEGWVVSSDKYGPGQFALIATPTASTGDLYEGGGLVVAFDRRPDMTPQKVLDEREPSSSCPDVGTTEPFTSGAFEGVATTFTGCPDGYQLRRIAVAVEGGTNLFLASTTTDGSDAAVEKALEGFVPGADPSVQTAPQLGCSGLEAPTDPDFPIGAVFKNHLDADITYGSVNVDTGEYDFDPVALPAGYTTGLNSTREGGVYRFTTPDGDQEYTVTADPLQCVILGDDGFTPVPTS